MQWFYDLALAMYLTKRARKTKATLCRRKSDGTLWVASSPQDMGYAMRGLFSGKVSWHFARVRIWRGVPVVSPRVFWSFTQSYHCGETQWDDSDIEFIARMLKAFDYQTDPITLMQQVGLRILQQRQLQET